MASLAFRLGEFGQPVTAVIESMNGARFVYDQLELRGWTVEIADAVKVKGFAPLAGKTDKIDAWVPAGLSRRDLVPALWLPTPGIRAERERARWRLHLVRHRSALKTASTPRRWHSGRRVRRRICSVPASVPAAGSRAVVPAHSSGNPAAPTLWSHDDPRLRWASRTLPPDLILPARRR